MRNVFVWMLLLAIVAGCGKSSGKEENGDWINETIENLTTFAEQGVAEAQSELGRRYHEGTGGVERDYWKAIEWFTKAAEQGHAKAQCSLGVCYQNGHGVEQDYVKAVEWFTKAAEQGDVDAQFFLGYRYAVGEEGVEQDPVKAFEWLMKAAEQGDVDAQFMVGERYAWGEGVEQDFEKAVEWWTKAAEQGDEDAKEALESLRILTGNDGNGNGNKNECTSSSSQSSSTNVSEPSGYINGHGYVNLGLSVKWAMCNVGASSPSDYGNYYAWGEISTKSEYTEENSKTFGMSMGSIAGNPECDAARANWGGTWRLPTKDEIEELRSECEWTSTSLGGHSGHKVTGPNGNSIFLPAAGWREETSLECVGERGIYWSDTPDEEYEENACGLGFYSDFFFTFTIWSPRYFGESVRPVSE